MTKLATLILSRCDVQALLDLPSCIDAIESALRLQAAGAALGPGVLGTHVEGGGFHVKAAGLMGQRPRYAAKINANFPENRRVCDLPTIQGVIALFDAANGSLLAILDSIEITRLRTAAASAIAAKHLAPAHPRILTIVGCGTQGRAHLLSMASVRAFDRVFAFDVDRERGAQFARELEPVVSIPIEPTTDARGAVRASDVVVTCTPSREPLIFRGDLRAGAFLVAVGADSEDKQELDPLLLADSIVVVDSLEQCATIGELHHALDARLMTRDDIRADLTAVVAESRSGRFSADEVVIFDSTGTALQDVAAAALAYERACAAGAGRELRLAD